MLTKANTEFAVKLYQELSRRAKENNVFFSPLSVSLALSMAFEGARGRTAEEMGRVLGLPDELAKKDALPDEHPWNTEAIHSEIGELLRTLKGIAEDPGMARKLERIEVLRARHQELEGEIRRLEEEGQWNELHQISEENWKAVQELNALLEKIVPYELNMANSLWGERSYPFRQEFLEVLAKHYGTGGVIPCDFARNHEAERARINQVVGEQTKERIPEILGEGSVGELTRLVLVNAIYFKGEWMEPFVEEETREESFYLDRGGKVQVPLMQDVLHCRYGAFHADGGVFDTPWEVHPDDRRTDDKYPGRGGFQVLELSYRGGQVSMAILLPRRGDDLAGLEKRLSTENLGRWLDSLKKREVHLILPKFRLETDYLLNDPLGILGMPSAFETPTAEGGGANFRGMTLSRDWTELFFISLVIHKAFVEVNEKGTEAAAATVMDMSEAACDDELVDFIPVFRADHPFLFLIRHRESRSVLFLGRIMNPLGK